MCHIQAGWIPYTEQKEASQRNVSDALNLTRLQLQMRNPAETLCRYQYMDNKSVERRRRTAIADNDLQLGIHLVRLCGYTGPEHATLNAPFYMCGIFNLPYLNAKATCLHWLGRSPLGRRKSKKQEQGNKCKRRLSLGLFCLLSMCKLNDWKYVYGISVVYQFKNGYFFHRKKIISDNSNSKQSYVVLIQYKSKDRWYL